MVLKPQDVIVALDLARERGLRCSYAELGERLGMSASEIHAAVRRLTEARLLDPETKVVRKKPLMNFITYGVPYAFAASLKEVTRGIPTAWAAPALASQFTQNDVIPPVWPDPDGTVQGGALQPLYRSVPQTAKRDSELYDLLALVDALRIGRARERSIAVKALDDRLKDYA